MELWIFTPFDHIQCGALDEYDELTMTRRNIREGSIQFISPLTDITKLIHTSSIVWAQGDETAYIVTTCEKRKSSNGKEIVIVNGACLKWILSMRSLERPKVYAGKTGAIMIKILTDVFAQSKKKFPRFSFEIDPALGDDMTMEAGSEDILRLFIALCEASGLTMRMTFNSHTQEVKLIVEAGEDHSINNGVLPIVQFDDAQETIENVEYTESINDAKNVMYIEDVDGVVMEVGATDKTGYERFEDSMKESRGRSYTTDDGTTVELTPEQYRKMKETEALKALDRKKPVESIEGDTAIENQQLVYGTDYRLGDIVTAKKSDWEVAIDVRVVEEAMKHRGGIITRNLTLGDPLPTIADRIKMR